MKKLYLFIGTFFILLLTACASTTQRSSFDQILLNENWIQKINTNPDIFVKHADPWFLSGSANGIENSVKDMPYSSAISMLKVRVPNFTNLTVNGPFQVQIVPTKTRNKVSVIGPNNQVRQLMFSVNGNTLNIAVPKDAPINCNNVIVRIEMRELNQLINSGPGDVLGRNIATSHLKISAYGSGHIYLVGRMNVTNISHFGSGCIVLIGADTPCLIVKIIGNGNLNISGRVGLQTLNQTGNGYVNIIGLDSNSLNIGASGAGKISLAGYAKVKNVVAVDSSQIYLYWVLTDDLHIIGRNNARIALAGCAENLDINLSDNAQFLGKYLHANQVYVRTADASHANVSAARRIYAAASGNSGIYFYGSPTIISRYVSGQSAIVPVWKDMAVPEVLPSPPPSAYMNRPLK